MDPLVLSYFGEVAAERNVLSFLSLEEEVGDLVGLFLPLNQVAFLELHIEFFDVVIDVDHCPTLDLFWILVVDLLQIPVFFFIKL